MKEVGFMLNNDRIKKLRLDMGISQQALGDLLGVTKVSVCGYENGTRTPSLETFNLLANIFNTTTDYLLGRSDESNPKNKYTNGDISTIDLSMIDEFKKYPELYNKLIKDSKRYVNLIFKKMK